MATLADQYKNIPVTIIDLSKVKKFLLSNLPFQTIIYPSLFPPGTSVANMVLKCSNAISELLSKANKYKELGYVKEDTQLMALGQLTNNSKIINYYLIAKRWQGSPNAAKTNALTKGKFVEELNAWFNFHKDRIGWVGVTAKPRRIKDPEDPKKIINYYYSDRYNKPINQCKDPYLGKHPVLGKINLSVAQAEQILINIIDRFTNNNELVQFSPDNPDERNAYTIIKYLSELRTDRSQTFTGVQDRFKNTVATIQQGERERKRRRMQKAAELNTEKALEEETARITAEIAQTRIEREEANKLAREKVFELQTVKDEFQERIKAREGK